MDALARRVVDAAYHVHRALGPGLLESVYEKCLAHELACRGLAFRSQVHVPLVYRGLRLDSGLRLDLLVGDSIVVEVKAVEAIAPVMVAQVLSYLKLTGAPLGFLINFHAAQLKDNIRRIVPHTEWFDDVAANEPGPDEPASPA